MLLRHLLAILAPPFVLLLAWAVTFWLTNQVYFLAAEEPGLRRRFGEDYRLYAANVPPWLPRRKAWKLSS
jgi:protein-S-isoprenylcysteine O-methyltransferase Ste14